MAIPSAEVKASLKQRLHERTHAQWPQLSRVNVRFRDQFAYVTGYLRGGEIRRLCRLRYTGQSSLWDFAMYLNGSYQSWQLPNGQFAGSPEDALDCACKFQLPPPTVQPEPRSHWWFWPAIGLTVAGMIGLLIYFLVVGVTQAAAISTIVGLFVAMAALIIAIIGLRTSAGSPARYDESKDYLSAPRITRTSELGMATAQLAIPLGVFATDSLLRYSATWPWLLAVIASLLGAIFTLYGSTRNVPYAAILFFNMLWFFTYSGIIFEFRQSSSPGDIGHLTTLS